MTKLKSLLNRLGCEERLIPQSIYLGRRFLSLGRRTSAGRCVSARIPRLSVFDLNCRTYDVDNLYVVDRSFFVSSTAVNPALTIMANALRVGDHFKERLGVSIA